jgi:type II secretory pathway pseudopilin PulG
MRLTLHPTRTRAGLTLVEALLATVLLSTLLVAVTQTSARASDAVEAAQAEYALTTATHRALERIVRSIEFADGAILSGQVLGPLGDDQVSFSTPVSFVDGVVTWMSAQILSELDEGELDDGADNDGDGLVDEGRVVLIEDQGGAAERRVVLTNGVAELQDGEEANNADDNGNGLVDETGLSFSATGETVFVRLTCQRRTDDGRLLVQAAETAVRLRNP